jgi:hypothetical protein
LCLLARQLSYMFAHVLAYGCCGGEIEGCLIG